MPKNPTDSDNSVQADKNKEDSHRGLWIIIGVGCVLLVAVIVVGAFFVDSQKIRFITEFSLTVALATLVGVQAYIYKRQWDSMEASVERTDRVIDKMDAQLTAIERQEAVLKIQARTMDRTLVFGNRAYLGIRCRFDVKKLRIFLYVENFGKVPANNVTVIFELEIATPWRFVPHLKPDEQQRGLGGSGLLGFIQNPDEHILKVPYLFAHGRTKIFPGGDSVPIMIRLDESPYISDTERAAILAGNSRVSVRGEITYSDGFHKGKVTDFAFRYFMKDDIWIPQKIEVPFELYGEPEAVDSDYDPG